MTTASRGSLGIAQSNEGDRVTTLELFFDLVFVFAFTQVTALMTHSEMPIGVLHGLIVLSLLWFGWASFAWLANQVRADSGIMRAAFVVAMVAMFVVSLAIPEAFHEEPGGIPAALTIVVCYAAVRLTHLSAYLLAAAGSRALQRQLLLTALTSVLPTVALLAIGAFVSDESRTWVWLAAVAYDLLAIFVGARSGGWMLPSAAHFAERHGLVVILALGESIVAIGVGISGKPLDWSHVLGAVLAIAIAIALWWLHFTRTLERLEASLHDRQDPHRAWLARDLFTYLHFPIIVGIIVAALGIESAMAHVHADHLGAVGGWALAGGTAAALAGSTGAICRASGRWPRIRLVATLVVLASGLVLVALPPLAALGLLAALLATLCVTEELS